MQREVLVRHILVSSRGEAEEIIQKIDAGAPFEELAGKYSKCSSSKEGGLLAWLPRGKMPREFDNVAFPLPKGMVSAPVKTELGWHIIKKIDSRM